MINAILSLVGWATAVAIVGTFGLVVWVLMQEFLREVKRILNNR